MLVLWFCMHVECVHLVLAALCVVRSHAVWFCGSACEYVWALFLRLCGVWCAVMLCWAVIEEGAGACVAVVAAAGSSTVRHASSLHKVKGSGSHSLKQKKPTCLLIPRPTHMPEGPRWERQLKNRYSCCLVQTRKHRALQTTTDNWSASLGSSRALSARHNGLGLHVALLLLC